MARGAVNYFEANGDVRDLQANKPKSPATTIALGDHQAVASSVGKTSRASYRLNW